MNFKVLGELTENYLEINQLKQFNYQDKTYILNNLYTIIVIEFEDQKPDAFSMIDQLKKELEAIQLDLLNLDMKDYLRVMESIPDYDLKNKVHHCFYEKHRIDEAIQHLQINNFDKLGQLMYQSYDSYKNFFNKTTQKQDFLMILAQKHQAIGANISHQNLICLVKSEQVDPFFEQINRDYQKIYHQKLRMK